MHYITPQIITLLLCTQYPHSHTTTPHHTASHLTLHSSSFHSSLHTNGAKLFSPHHVTPQHATTHHTTHRKVVPNHKLHHTGQHYNTANWRKHYTASSLNYWAGLFFLHSLHIKVCMWNTGKFCNNTRELYHHLYGMFVALFTLIAKLR